MAIARRILPARDTKSASRLAAEPRLRRERALAGLATRQKGVVAAWQLRQLDFSWSEISRRVDVGRLHQVHAGVYAVGHRDLTLEGRWLAAAFAGGNEALLSHRDCLALRGLADFRLPEIEITIPGLGSRRRPGLRIHRTRHLDPLDREVVSGIPVTSLARTLVDVAGSISARHLRDVYLEAERRNLLDIDSMVRVVQSSKGKRGINKVRRLLAEDTAALARTKSRLEVRFFDFCRKHDLPLPLVNYWVHGYEVDAYWPAARLAVEVDSWEFHRGRKSFERDRERIADLRLAGIEVLPVTDRRMKEMPERVAGVIRKALAERTDPADPAR